MYGIHATYFFYAGTYNAPTDGVIAAYNTRAEADTAMSALTYNRYYLAHGEYAQPEYKITGYNPGKSGLSEWLKDKSDELAKEAAYRAARATA
jgi:hypothetical protein